jgi:GMP synthase-like glutamine amidotransferase
MRVLAFRHVPFESLGLIEPALRTRHIEVDYADLYQTGALPPDIAVYDALIFLGGPMSVNDDLAFLRREMEFIRQATERRQPILGICLGAQLIARALGAAVRRNPASEIGWYDLHFTEAAAGDRLFHGLFRETVFHWHGETFDLPPGAELMASSARCRNQAFRIGEAVSALQFHLEVTPEMIADWCVQDENCGDVRELKEVIDPYLHAPRLAALSAQVFGSWSEILRSRSSSSVPSCDTGEGTVLADLSVEMARGPEKESADEALDKRKHEIGEDEVEETAGLDRPACPRCGWRNTRLSHTRSTLDAILRTFSLRAFRCRSCGNRFRVFRRDPET